MIWNRYCSGIWAGENETGQATIVRATNERETNRKRHRWRVNVIVPGARSTWAILGSIPAAKRYAERFIDRHTEEK